MPTIDTATVYPGMCLFEGTNVSEGRGTSRPFEQIGAPWIDPFRLSDAANALNLPAVFFRPTYFVPTTRKFEGQRCAGVHIHITNRNHFEPVCTALHLMVQICNLYPDAFEFQVGRIDRLFGTSLVREQLEKGMPVSEMVESWATSRQPFERLRTQYLLYT